MPRIKTEYSCPTCRKTTGKAVQIIANEGLLICEVGHRWGDTQQFMNEHPMVEFKPEVAKNLIQDGYVPLTISVPAALKDHLQENYGEQLSPTVVAVLSQLSTNSMVISETDIIRLRDHLGKQPVNSSELVGLVYAKKCEADDAKLEKENAVKDLKAYEGLSLGRVVVDLGDQLQAAKERAADANMPLKLWVETRFNTALKDGWF